MKQRFYITGVREINRKIVVEKVKLDITCNADFPDQVTIPHELKWEEVELQIELKGSGDTRAMSSAYLISEIMKRLHEII